MEKKEKLIKDMIKFLTNISEIGKNQLENLKKITTIENKKEIEKLETNINKNIKKSTDYIEQLKKIS